VNTFLSYLAIGLSAGLVYGLLALGLVLVYKGTRVLNFAHPYFGLQTAFLAWWLTAKASFPPFSWLPFGANTLPRFAIAVVIALGFIALNGWVIERTIMHHLRNASRLIQLVATIALAQGAVGFVTLLFARNDEQAADFRALPRVLDSLSFEIGTRVISGADILVFIVTPLLCGGAALFFTKTKFGVAVRGVAENRDAARLLGISADRVSSFVWVTGALLAGIAGILITMVRGSLDPGSLSTGFLVRGLAAALVGGLTSLPGAIVGGLSVGVLEALLRMVTDDQPGWPETLLFVVIITILLFRPGGIFGQKEETEDKVAFVPALRDLPARLRDTAGARTLRWMLPITIVFVIGLSLVTGPATNGAFIRIAIFAMVGISLTVLMGYSGQVSLGQWGLTGVGAFAAANLYTRVGLPWLVSVAMAVLVGMAVSLFIGLPALRIKGLYLAVATLAFNLAAEFFIFKSRLIGGSTAGIAVNPPKLGPLDLDSTTKRPLFLVCLVALLLCAVVARNLNRSRTGRGFLAIRENEKAATTFGVSLVQYRLVAFATSGGIAALAGALFATELKTVESTTWTTSYSLLLVAMVMIGGLGSLLGSVLGAILVFGVPLLVHFDNGWIVPIGTGILLIVVITRAPAGLAGIVQWLRGEVVETLDDLDRLGAPQPPAGGALRRTPV
jgi:ABC-type branched-subunit amino acid transport system permease subunit